jgi:hypothetical protein
MPSSQASIIPCVISVIRQIRPASILDVGVGFGKWGYLFREYTDIAESEDDPGRYPRSGWRVRIEGIEAFAPYLHDGHRFSYDRIHVGDAREVLPRLGAYDVVFLGEMIEHLPMAAGEEVLRIALDHADRYVILTTPAVDTGQGTACGNPLERHCCVWRPEDFRRIGPCLLGWADKRTRIVAYPRGDAAPVRLWDDRVVAAPPPPAPRTDLFARFGRLLRRCGRRVAG